MTSSGEGPGTRVVIDPTELRELASRLRQASEELAWTGRRVATCAAPEMPAGVAGLVGDAVYRVNAELQELAIEFEDEARSLEARATWAELGAGAGLGWLLPALGRFPHVSTLLSDATGQITSAAPAAAATGFGTWAEDLIEGMPISDEGEIDFDATTFDRETVGDPVGDFTLASDLNFDLTALLTPSAPAIEAARAVLQTGLSTDSSDPIAAGIAGCILVGVGHDWEAVPSTEFDGEDR